MGPDGYHPVDELFISHTLYSYEKSLKPINIKLWLHFLTILYFGNERKNLNFFVELLKSNAFVVDRKGDKIQPFCLLQGRLFM